MGILDNIRWGFRQIRKRLLESLLIILGIALGVAVICCVVGLIENFTNQTGNIMNGMNLRTFQLVPKQNSYNREDIGKPVKRIGRSDEENVKITFEDYLQLKEADLEGIENVWFCETSTERLTEDKEPPAFEDFEEEQKWYDENMLWLLLSSPEVFEIAELSLVKGDIFRDSDLLDKNKVVVVGDELANSYFPNEDPIGKEINLQLGSYKVIGVVHREADEEKMEYVMGIGSADRLNKQIFIPFYSYDNGYSNETDELHQLFVLAEENVELEVFHSRLRNYIKGNLKEGIDVTGMSTYQNDGKKAIFTIGKTIGIFACAALLIAAVNILNLMMARVLRRYKQIGISAALGASRRDIFKLFLVEAMILGFLGSLIGVGFALGGLKLLSKIIKTSLSLSLMTVVIGVGVAVLTSLIFGLYPASQAARVRPVDALKMD